MLAIYEKVHFHSQTPWLAYAMQDGVITGFHRLANPLRLIPYACTCKATLR